MYGYSSIENTELECYIFLMPLSQLTSRASTSKRGAARTTRSSAAAPKVPASPNWTFLTNHAHVLLCVTQDPDARIRDMADAVGITERAVQRILADLSEAGYLSTERTGRRNVYRVNGNMPFRHPLERHREVSMLLKIVVKK